MQEKGGKNIAGRIVFDSERLPSDVIEELEGIFKVELTHRRTDVDGRQVYTGTAMGLRITVECPPVGEGGEYWMAYETNPQLYESPSVENVNLDFHFLRLLRQAFVAKVVS